jgi:homoserine kinase
MGGCVAEASAPASSANLGPGYDILALALEIRCSVTAVPSETWTINHLGPELPDGDGADAVLIGAQRVVGKGRPLELTVTNHIPIGKGLGSSAAAAAAGSLAAWRALGEEPDPRKVFELVSDCEGHPDNAAATVYGGLTLCSAAGGTHRLAIHPGIHPVLAVPSEGLATSVARQVVAALQPTATVVRSLARLAALVGGFFTADPVLFNSASGDELHEQPRNELRPEVARLINVARSAGALHACWSGAGPSVLALVPGDLRDHVAGVLRMALPEGRVMMPSIASTGIA